MNETTSSHLPTVYDGRPTDIEHRSEREMRCYELLDRLSIPYKRADHAPAMTMQDCEAIDAALGCDMCKNLFLTNKQKTRYFLLLLPGTKPFKTGVFSRIMGSSRLSFAGAEDMERLLGLYPGAVSLMGLMNDTDHAVTLYVDRALLSQPLFGMHPCANTSSLCLSTADALGPLLKEMDHELNLIDLPDDQTPSNASTTEKE